MRTIPIAAAALVAGLSGTITTSVPTPVPGVQRFTLSCGFTRHFRIARPAADHRR